ncbi:hypothetical protein HK100_012662 [Physocladia obscura]|uniref:AAA+ ATPase domain-containing protein n=1 Tax=Physocladia obscura TaxID=109957 RepID=A0AAD5XFQ7_9FUNG|nr:hypothetical protein HK100_012662 [Physocladia obscura]
MTTKQNQSQQDPMQALVGAAVPAINSSSVFQALEHDLRIARLASVAAVSFSSSPKKVTARALKVSAILADKARYSKSPTPIPAIRLLNIASAPRLLDNLQQASQKELDISHTHLAKILSENREQLPEHLIQVHPLSNQNVNSSAQYPPVQFGSSKSVVSQKKPPTRITINRNDSIVQQKREISNSQNMQQNHHLESQQNQKNINTEPQPQLQQHQAIQSIDTQIMKKEKKSCYTMTDPISEPPQPKKPQMRSIGTMTDQSVATPSAISRISNKRSLPEEAEEADQSQQGGPKTSPTKPFGFISGLAKKAQDDVLKGKSNGFSSKSNQMSKPSGLTKPTGVSKFKPPFKTSESEPTAETKNGKSEIDIVADERLKGIDPAMVEAIMNEIVDGGKDVSWDDIAGLEHAKQVITESIIWPMQRPDIFCGIRSAPKGLLLFGPPGTGKTLIGKCIATQSGAKFFSISSSSLTSKWVGDGEKLVRALFAVARAMQPSVIFMDEIDSLLTQRTDGENEASRRIKTEFLVQFDGCGTNADDMILLIGATNRPQELDDAAGRRFRKKLYIPLPEYEARRSLLIHKISKQNHCLTENDIGHILEKTNGYSGSDMDGLVREAALGPIRRLKGDILRISVEDVPPMALQDFSAALTQVRASVTERDLDLYLKFDGKFGSAG